MAFITAAKPGFHLSSFLARPFVALWDGMIAMAESHPKMVQVNTLNAFSDAQLAERGTTREAEVRRIFGSQYHI